ncbi:hypothetical protein [Rhodothermus bifroesti]|uniref:hypothetical protein n=1 Tax=Rhodothermus bifroesti TaxID=2823335 RepID=UPI001AEF575F|nr:hypothetical protein [Rhodothermus bifroesti]
MPALPEVRLGEKLQELGKQLREGEPKVEQFREAYDELRKLNRRLQELLQWAVEQRRDEKELNNLYCQVAGWNASDLVEHLKRTGFRLKQDRVLKEAFDRQGYRILELVRAGKRDEAFHAILRIFVSAKREFPAHLVEAFKPVYSDTLFRVFLFSFLSGILGKEQESE